MLDRYGPLLVQADAPGVQNRSGQNSVRNRRKTLGVKLRGLRLARADAPGSVNEFLNGHIAVSTLSIEVPTLGWRVFHAGDVVSRRVRTHAKKHRALEGVVPVLPCLVLDNVIATMRLVHVDFTLSAR